MSIEKFEIQIKIMKGNIMIIVLVTLVALGVIITVIVASVANGHEKPPVSNSIESSSVSSKDSNYIIIPSDSMASESSYSQVSSSDGGYTIGDAIVRTAREILEREEKVPFLENGASLEGFDNSGFIYYVLLENGFSTCPRSLQDQATFGSRLEYDKLKRGDLVFFYIDNDPSLASYGGIYSGSGKMIACLEPGTYVDEIDISVDFYRKHFYCGVSLS